MDRFFSRMRLCRKYHSIMSSKLLMRRLCCCCAAILIGLTYMLVVWSNSHFRHYRLPAGGQACRHPDLNVNNSYIMSLLKKHPTPLVCSKIEDWVQMNGSTARITEEAQQHYGYIECAFTDVFRGSDDSTHNGVTTFTHTEYNLEESDFVRVKCQSEKGNTWHNVMEGIRHDQDVLDRTGWDKVPEDGLHLNVLMWGFDSLSHNMFARQLPRTLRYLREILGAIELKGYNIVGDGTPQAFIPILTGKTERELPETRRRMGDKANFVNVYPFVWKEFQANGYVTGFVEDLPQVGTFTYRLKGFDAQPTDHYGRTFYIEASKIYKMHPKFCLGSLPRHKVMMNYVHDFFKVYHDKPKFLFAFHSEVSHEYLSEISIADEDTQQWLQTLYEEGHLNSTLLILMSDHGHRFSEVRNSLQGKLEERLPMFSFVFPQWFIRAYPDAIANLKQNIHSLTTPFDIHPTLLNVLHFDGAGLSDKKRSISLFKKIPLSRTCADAGIEDHWCACLDWHEVRLSDSTVLQAASAAVNFLNKLTEEEREICSLWNLDSIVWAAKLTPSQGLLHFHHSADDDGFVPDLSARTKVLEEKYQLRLLLQPGLAFFEISVTHVLQTEKFCIKESDVSRTNEYHNFTFCLNEEKLHLRKYCHCSISRGARHSAPIM